MNDIITQFEDEPWKMFFMEEYIPGTWKKLLDPKIFNQHLNDCLPAIDHLMNAFQHWTYNHTKGQMIITNLQGVIPLISKPKIIDLNPK